MNRIYTLVLVFFVCPFIIFGQTKIATYHEDFTITIEESEDQIPSYPRSTLEQINGFPKGFVAHPNHKNIRNVTLADINLDGTEDVLFAANNQLYVYSNGNLLWSRALSGVGLYPPSVGDIDGDGKFEIVQGTGGTTSIPKLHAFDNQGNALAGFPISLNDQWILTAPTLSDLDNDGQMEIIATQLDGSSGKVHVLKNDGTPFNNNWPVQLTNRPATTASVGDIDNDGTKDIIVHSTRQIYALDLNGQNKSGFPIVNPNTWFSFQSPYLSDLDGDNQLEIIGASHGDAPEFYAINSDGSYHDGWPIAIPDNEWTFNTPTVIERNNQTEILMSRRGSIGVNDMLYNWDGAGQIQSGFPIIKEGGTEGVISVADIDNDGEAEIIFSSNMIGTDGFGFIHAYEMDGSGEVENFPVRPRGWTLMNGATIGDVDGDGQLDMTVLSYTQTFGQDTDSIYLNAYNLGVPFGKNKIWWTGYKGSNTREGAINPISTNIVENHTDHVDNFLKSASPNPFSSNFTLETHLNEAQNVNIYIQNPLGQAVFRKMNHRFAQGKNTFELNLRDLPNGFYFLSIFDNTNNLLATKKIIKSF